MTVAFSSASTTSSSLSITITVASSVARGSYSILITASGAGVANAQATFTLTVSGTPVNLTFCRNIPIWVAVQEGTGAWRQVVGAGAGAFPFDMATPTGAIALVFQGTSTTDSYSFNLLYASIDQLKEYATAQCDVPGTKAVMVNVVKAPADRANVQLGPSYAPGGTTSTAFTFPTVPNGPVDLIVARIGASAASNRVVIRRGLNVSSGTTLPTVDLTTTTEGFVLDTRTVTTNGLQAGDVLSVSGAYMPSVLTGIAMPIGVSTSVSAASYTFPVLPPGEIVTGDLHEVQATGTTPAFASYTTAALMRTPLNVSLTLPAPPVPATVSVASTSPHVRPRVAFARQNDYGEDFWINLNQGAAGVFSRSMFIEVTGAYFGSAATDYTMPDFSGVAGFNNAWSLKTAQTATWQLLLQGRTLAQTAWATKNIYLDGQQFRFGVRTGTLTP